MNPIRFPVLLEVRQDGRRPIPVHERSHGHPTDVAVGYYECGRRPDEDRVVAVRTLVATAADERQARGEPNGRLTWLVPEAGVLSSSIVAPDEAVEAWEGHPVVEAAHAPGGHGVALVTATGDEGRILWIQDRGGRRQPLDLGALQPHRVAWLHDGSGVVFTDGPSLYLSTLDGSVRKLSDETEMAAVSPDGASIARVRLSEEGMALCRLDVATGETVPLFVDLPWQHVENVAWSPEGSRIIVSVGCARLADAQLRYVPEVWAFAADGSSVAVVSQGQGIIAVEPYVQEAA